MSDVEARNRRSEARGSGKKVRVTIPRSDPGAQNTFEVDRTDPTLLLDLLLAIQRRHDPSLAFRYSCRVAMCNMCGVRVDGGNVLACRVPLEAVRDEKRRSPMQEATLVRDLSLEIDQFVDEWV